MKKSFSIQLTVIVDMEKVPEERKEKMNAEGVKDELFEQIDRPDGFSRVAYLAVTERDIKTKENKPDAPGSGESKS